MSRYDFAKMEKKLSKYLDEDRFRHTMGVKYTCACLAMAHGADMDDAQAAGLLHDSAKCIPNKKKIRLCHQHHIPVTSFEEEHPFLLHSKLGAYIAEAKYGIANREILSAIAFHTTGKPRMTLLEKIVYIADYIEPMREKAPNLARIRRLAFENLDACMYEILKDTLQYLDENPEAVEPTTKAAFVYYQSLHTKGGERE